MARPRLALMTAAAAVLAGCAVGPDFHPPAPPAVDRYTSEALPPDTGPKNDQGTADEKNPGQRFALGAAVDDRWWRLFGSPALDALEDEALTANPDLQSAQAALRGAREVWLAQRATQYPTVDLSASGVRARNSATIAPPLVSNADLYSLYSAQLNISYVPDVFGGARRQTESAAAQAENQRFLTQAVYLTLTVNVAGAAVQLASLGDQLEDTRLIIRAMRDALGVTERRQRLGEASTADVSAAQTALEQAEQLAPPIQKQIEQTRDLLAALVGRPPSRPPAAPLSIADLSLPGELPVSLPSVLVRQRPDVRAAEANIHVASAQLGVATAARLPSFAITAAPGGAASEIDTLFSNGNALWSVTGAASQTVFDFGALRHRQGAARAALDQSKAQYRSAVLAALQNTADALRSILGDARGLEHAGAAESAAARSLSLARSEYEHGETGVLPVLAAQGAWRQARVTLTQARATRYTDTIALYQALGGGWHD